ncbi:MAG TPA: pantoate--beta-alanine ligase, partial [Gemmatales bacterium]|nr:pantoate--beta-alanine ligase [Gemmatales bacterium]
MVNVVRSAAELQAAVATARGQGLRIGFVPTMGALHAGHASLIDLARAQAGFVVVSIFVNPAQFGPNEDFAAYPRPLEADLEVCQQHGADLAFVPSVAEIYPPGFQTFVEVADLERRWEGEQRPGHFRGVATVVLKLFNLVRPDVAFFGQKDAQQCRVVEQMVADLAVPVQIVIGPTIREADGLALSSRNVYLTPEQRRRAPALWQALNKGKELIESGERQAAVVRRGQGRPLRAHS